MPTPASPRRRPSTRGLAVGVGLLALGAASLHARWPALPFPMRGAWFVGGGLAALLTAALPAGPLRALGALCCWGALLVGGLPANHRATFPFLELGAARTPMWEDLTLFSLVALRFSLAAPGAAGGPGVRALRGGLGLLGLIGLGVAHFAPTKLLLQALGPAAPGQTPAPLLGWSAPTMVRWGRINASGSAWLQAPALIRDEWALLELAGGIHQQAGAAAGEAARMQPLRFVEIKLLEWVAALVLLLRLAALPAASLAGLAALRRWAAAAALHTWATRAVQIALIGVPCANLIAGALAAALGLPDDAALRAPALASAAGTLLCLLLVEACATEAHGPAPAAPEPT